MHQPKPWFRASKNAWYLQVGKRQISLGSDEKEAFRRFHRLMADGVTKAVANVSVAVLCDLFLDWCKDENVEETYEWYKRFLEKFADQYGGLNAADLRPLHVNGWVKSYRKRWGQSTRRCAIICVKRAVSWGLSEGYLSSDPLRTLKKPAPKRRERILTSAERKAIFGSITDREFKMFYFALCECGARPGEITRVAAENIQGDMWVFKKHKTGKRTGKPRVVYLTPPLVKLCKRLVQENPEGPIFRNSLGKPWTRNAVRIRFRNLRKRLKLDGVVAYTVRHTYCTDGLEAGVPIATMSELLGHSSTRMVSLHYNHLGEKREYLLEAARKVTRRA